MAENLNDIANIELSGMRRQANELLVAAFKRGYCHGVAVGECREESGMDSGLRWIPTKDKLPPVGARVLTCDDEGNIYTTLTYAGHVWRWDADYERKSINLIAWMSLPEPYKVVEEKKPKTRAERFYEMFPKCARVFNTKTNREAPSSCWKDIVGGAHVCLWPSEKCYDCWDEPYDGELEGDE